MLYIEIGFHIMAAFSPSSQIDLPRAKKELLPPRLINVLVDPRHHPSMVIRFPHPMGLQTGW